VYGAAYGAAWVAGLAYWSLGGGRWTTGTQSFHNTISQWLLPKFFAGGENEFWLGEGGLLPLSGYVVASVTVYVWMPHARAIMAGACSEGAREPGRRTGRIGSPRQLKPMTAVQGRVGRPIACPSRPKVQWFRPALSQ
jgi:hypothetical protein